MQKRIRTIKGEMFTHEAIFDLGDKTGLPIFQAVCGMLSISDREGRFKWRPRAIKAEILPYHKVDMAEILDALVSIGFIAKYTVENEDFGVVINFKKHQVINSREAKSVIPEPPASILDSLHVHAREVTVQLPVHAQGEGKGREGKGREGKGVKLLDGTQEKKSAAVLPLQQQKPKATATEAARADFVEEQDNDETPILDAWEAKFADAIAPEPVLACFNGDRHAAELLAEAVEFADDGELDRFIAFAKGSDRTFVAKALRSVHFFATNAGTLLADLRATEAAVRTKVGELQPKQKPAPKEADYLEALRRGSEENRALDSVGVLRPHFASVLESWRKDADFRALERKARAEGEQVREKLRAENAERRKALDAALDAPRVSDAGMVSAAPESQAPPRKAITPEQRSARLAELNAQRQRPA